MTSLDKYTDEDLIRLAKALGEEADTEQRRIAAYFLVMGIDFELSRRKRSADFSS